VQPGATTVVAVLVVVGLAGVALVGCSRGDDPSAADAVMAQRERQARSAAAEAGLPRDVQSVLGLAARAPAASCVVTYSSGTDRLVVAQRPPRRRVDVLGEGGAPVESVVTDADGGVVGCSRARTGTSSARRWRCRKVAAEAGALPAAGAGAFTPELVARTVEALAAARDAFTVDVYRLRLAGVTATCLRSTPTDPGPPSTSDAPSATAPTTSASASASASVAQLCVAPDGVPLLLDRADGTPVLRAVAYRPSASAADVRRPDHS
jgi:hypothetical protein